MTHRPTSPLIRPAVIALTGLMLSATPVALGASGLVAQSALAASKDDSRDKGIHESVDKTSTDSNDKQTNDRQSNDGQSNDTPSPDTPSPDA
jgi:hypothetical protein